MKTKVRQQGASLHPSMVKVVVADGQSLRDGLPERFVENADAGHPSVSEKESDQFPLTASGSALRSRVDAAARLHSVPGSGMPSGQGLSGTQESAASAVLGAAGVGASATAATGLGGTGIGTTGRIEDDISAHLPMVRYLARRIHERLPSHVEMDDLVSAGLVGLMDAYQKFNPAKQVQFRSYAQFRVRGAILDSLRTLDWSPRELRRKGRAVEEAIQVLTRRWGRSPNDQEIAAEMHLGLEQYQQLLGELKGLEIGTLNAERSEDSGEEEIAYLPNSPTDDPLFRCLKSELHTRLVGAIEHLTERERLVLTLYYFEELTMKEIGATLGVVESRISQIHSSAVLRLRAFLQTETLTASPEPTKRRLKAR